MKVTAKKVFASCNVPPPVSKKGEYLETEGKKIRVLSLERCCSGRDISVHRSLIQPQTRMMDARRKSTPALTDGHQSFRIKLILDTESDRCVIVDTITVRIYLEYRGDFFLLLIKERVSMHWMWDQ